MNDRIIYIKTKNIRQCITSIQTTEPAEKLKEITDKDNWNNSRNPAIYYLNTYIVNDKCELIYYEST